MNLVFLPRGGKLLSTTSRAPAPTFLAIRILARKFVFSPKLPVFADFGSFCSPGLSTEGIYRVSGNKSEMESLQRQFDQGNTRTPNLWLGWGCLCAVKMGTPKNLCLEKPRLPP